MWMKMGRFPRVSDNKCMCSDNGTAHCQLPEIMSTVHKEQLVSLRECHCMSITRCCRRQALSWECLQAERATLHSPRRQT